MSGISFSAMVPIPLPDFQNVSIDAEGEGSAPFPTTAGQIATLSTNLNDIPIQKWETKTPANLTGLSINQLYTLLLKDSNLEFQITRLITVTITAGTQVP